MKHAYLIIAHNEFEILQRLISMLDDFRNDIFVHIDKKVRVLPQLVVRHSNLILLSERIDVRWGSISQIKAEYQLFEAATAEKTCYDRYHLVSGTHLPLKSQDYIHTFFQAKAGKELLSFLYTDAYEINMKLGKYHFFLNYFQYGKRWQRLYANFFWHVLLKLQYLFRVQREIPKVDIKANNWVSLTDHAVQHILRHKNMVLKQFRWTLCGDEYFVPYLLMGTDVKFVINNEERLLFNEFEGSNARILTPADGEFLIDSEYLFARKFSESALSLVDRIAQSISRKI